MTDPNRRAVRASALYDLLVTWPLVLPWTQGAMHALLAALHQRLGLSGQWPALDPMAQFFAGLLGSLVLVWSLARWRSPSDHLGRWDVASRLAFAAWQLAAVAGGLSPILLAFTAFELGFALLQRPCFRRAA